VEVKLWHGDTLLADDDYKLMGQEANRKIAITDPGIDDSRNELLWSPERPTLLDAELTCAATAWCWKHPLLHGAALGGHQPRPLHAERPPISAAAGAGPGLLAGSQMTAPSDER
jgi:hypothetical protein